MTASDTILAMLAGRDSQDLAITGAGDLALSYRDVLALSERIAGQLASYGIGRTDRVAIVTSNGPGAAIAFLAATSAGIAAPLNPAYRQQEFEFALGDLPARVLLTDGSAPPATAAAVAMAIPVVRLSPSFEIEGGAASCRPPAPGDVALVLHTSGTTGAPKRVPLTHANLTHSARNIAASLELSPADRCLNVMPLFHIHGLVGALLSSLTAGASVVCTPGFDAFKMPGWLETRRPTWYSAVPTMHQALLARARGRGAAPNSLRFIRSASSALPPTVMSQLEDVFGAPVVEAFGMTEASHQVAVNPLPPRVRHAGSVGLPAGVEVAVFGPGGDPLGIGSEGEIGIRGPSVTAGYEGVDSATFTFPGGWLRTGDQGRLDSDGYLWLTGRLKEMVNRGGEKISPREIEEVLLAHPSVGQAVVFAVPHEKLGEDVAAAVVPAAAEVDVAELRAFLAERLAAFKVPRKIVVLEAIPLGPTGKPQRVGMAERLGIA